MIMNLRFNREEFAGSLGNLGTIVPLTSAMVVTNGLDPTAVFVVMGAFYLLSGLYFRVPVPVEPMKVIAAYAIATSLSCQRITAAALCLGVLLILLGASGTITHLARWVPKSCVRGVQLTTGVLLFIQGVKFMLGKTAFQASQGKTEPFLSVQTVGPVPMLNNPSIHRSEYATPFDSLTSVLPFLV
jgi:sulfate permease, SulP family